MVRYLLPLFFAASVSAVTNIYASSYAGNVTTLSLGFEGVKRTLAKTSVANVCGFYPSWLNFDSAARVLYCLDEGWEHPNGTLTSSTVSKDGKLTQVAKVATPNGPVSGVFYNTSAGRGYAVAYYGGAAVGVFNNSRPNMVPVQDFHFNLTKPGAKPDRQEAPHPHEAITDPTGKYVIVPDLGADLVRIYQIETSSLALKEVTPLTVAPGTGPRHAAFWVSPATPSATYFFLVSELNNRINTYKVTYGTSGLTFAPVANYSTFGNATDPGRGGAAEITVAPDNKFLVVSNRNDSSFALPASITPSKPGERSDSLSSWAINNDGTLNFTQLVPAGGMGPRHFSFNKAGDVVAVALQQSGRVAIINRDWEGVIKEVAATVPVEGEVNCVVWDEQQV